MSNFQPYLKDINSFVAIFINVLKSIFRWLLQNRRTRPQVVAGKHGLAIPWNILAMALPFRECSWPYKL